METLKKEIDGLLFLDITEDYIVVNDGYHGLMIMDHSMNVVRNIELNDDVVITFSAKNKNKMLLVCYEEECAFYVDLEKGVTFKFDLKDLEDIYFSKIYFWENNNVFLFNYQGDVCVVFDLDHMKMTKTVSDKGTEKEHFLRYMELRNMDVLSYHHDNDTLLFVSGSHYHIWENAVQKDKDMDITAAEQKDDLPSDKLYFKTDYTEDTIICVSERAIMLSRKDDVKITLYPPYDLYRFIDAGIIKIEGKEIVFALSNDNSAVGPTLLIKYDVDK